MLHRNSSGFDEKETLDDLIKTYGYEAGFEPEEPAVKGSPTKKRKGVKDEGEKDQAGSPSSVKKVRKTDIVAREENRAAAEAIKEMADIYFKNKDNRKGGIIDNIQQHYSWFVFHIVLLVYIPPSWLHTGVFSKAAKAIREAEVVITDKKSAMKLPGVGKGIAGYMEELQEKGSIKHLEELRAGTA